MESYLPKIHSGEWDEDWLVNEMYFTTADKLMKSYRNGYVKEFFAPDWTIEDTKLVNRVHNNIFAFSGAKTYAELKELRNAVYENGKLLPWDEYRNRALKINSKYNLTYLDAERSLVMASGTAGSRWLDIEETIDTHPYLEYVTAGDDRVREEHQLLNGIILPVDDPFWRQYYFPNGWRCRCSVRKRTEREYNRRQRITGSDEAQKLAGKVVTKPFRHNVGTSNVIDRDGHPYFKANADAKEMQLSATKHYGMKPAKEIYQDGRNLSGYKGGITDEKQYREYWAMLEQKYGKPGEGFTIVDNQNYISASFDRKLMDKIMDKNRIGLLDEVENIINYPNEIWATWKSSGKRRFKEEYFNVYVKYYKDKPVVLLVNSEGRVDSLYHLDTLEQTEQFRTGLLKRKK